MFAMLFAQTGGASPYILTMKVFFCHTLLAGMRPD